MKDLFGTAILDYYTNNCPEDIGTQTNISELDTMSTAYLFRDYTQMPILEQKALQLCSGKVLDIGCGAGSHSLYLQNYKNLDVTAIDISNNAIKTCQLRGVKNTYCKDILDMEYEKFDTILLLMNGTGIFKSITEMPKYLLKLKSLLNTDGKILIDSSDIIYMFDQDQEYLEKQKSYGKYYGELEFVVSYKNQKDIPFPWLYLDYKTLKSIVTQNNMTCKLIDSGEHYDYLAMIK